MQGKRKSLKTTRGEYQAVSMSLAFMHAHPTQLTRSLLPASCSMSFPALHCLARPNMLSQSSLLRRERAGKVSGFSRNVLIGVLHLVFSTHTLSSLHMNSVNDISPPAGKCFDEFMKHFSVKRNVEAVKGDHGLELRVIQEVRSGDSLLAIPRRAVLEVGSGASCPCKDYVAEEVWQAVPAYAQLAIRLLHSMDVADEDSRALRDYLDALPKRVKSALSWSEEAIEELQDAHMVEQVHRRRSKIRELYRNIESFVGSRIAFDRFCWAVESAGTHVTYDTTKHEFQIVAGVADCSCWSTYHLLADKDFQVGQSVEISYGIKSNDELLLSYGFIVPDNPEDFFVIKDAKKMLSTVLKVNIGDDVDIVSPVITRDLLDDSVASFANNISNLLYESQCQLHVSFPLSLRPMHLLQLFIAPLPSPTRPNCLPESPTAWQHCGVQARQARCRTRPPDAPLRGRRGRGRGRGIFTSASSVSVSLFSRARMPEK
eukprot:753634-Hanusia_phi.AAC.4